jgi:DNA-binding PadR family transcriptional regulator
MVKYGVLGLLIERRGYGYELIQRLSARLGPAWDLSRSAVYAALDQLESDGHIRSVSRVAEEEPSSPRVSRRSERVLYEPTDQGIAEFRRWVAEPVARAEPIRSELHLKLALAGIDQLPELLDAVAHEEQMTTRRHEECVAATTKLVAAGPGGAQISWAATGASLINAAAAERLQGELVWIRSVRELLERVNRSGEPPLAEITPH